MNYRVGQRVRFLHESGEGVITALIDRHHVEVDLGDDFPMDMHVDELIPIDHSENTYLSVTKTETETPKEVAPKQIKRFGGNLYSLSMALCPVAEDRYDCIIINPHTTQALYTCYLREKHKYTGMGSGHVEVGTSQKLFSLREDQLRQVKQFYWQILPFSPGKGHPHQPHIQEIAWNKGRMGEKMRFIDAVGKEGWIFSLTEKDSEIDRKLKIESEFVRVKETDIKKKGEKVVDLHIEELTDRAWEMAPSMILDLQLKHMEKSLSEAIIDNFESMVLIHGVGEGVLRKAIRKRLKQLAYVESFEQADPRRFGNGATKIYFK